MGPQAVTPATPGGNGELFTGARGYLEWADKRRGDGPGALTMPKAVPAEQMAPSPVLYRSGCMKLLVFFSVSLLSFPVQFCVYVGMN